MNTLPRRVRVVEVGPRDGLQNEAIAIPTEVKLAFIRALVDAGLHDLEVTSFVHPARIPQLADAEAVIAALPSHPEARYSALVPNERGLDRALASGIGRIAVFTGASETFVQRNIGMSIRASLDTFARVITRAEEAGVSVRGYVSTCWECPYEGRIAPEQVIPVVRELLSLGVDEVSLGDTIGAAAPAEVRRLLQSLQAEVPVESLALHFHDTNGTALANVYAGLLEGVTIFDSSAGGLGGCPYAPGASGNLATEDLLYMLDRLGIETGASLIAVAAASSLLQAHLDHPLPGRVYQRLQAQQSPTP